MSGGSYDYLCFAEDAEQLARKREALEDMAERLGGLSWAQAAAVETYRLLAVLERLDARLAAAKELRDVWHAIEWWDSCDYSEKQAREAMREYEDAV